MIWYHHMITPTFISFFRRFSIQIFSLLWLQEILYWFYGRSKEPQDRLGHNDLPHSREAETIIVRSREVSHWWLMQYLDECLQIPIKQLSIILGAGPGLPVFLGLRGDVWRPKGREYNYWAWQKSDNKWNTLGHIKITKPGDPGFLPHPSPGENTPILSLPLDLMYVLDYSVPMCWNWPFCFVFPYWKMAGILNCYCELSSQML